jgi:hypothetical protein
MNRCLHAALIGLLLALSTLRPSPALAQADLPSRVLPTDVQRGVLVITQAPDVRLDGRGERLSPGARIRNTSNLLLLSGEVTGRALPVIYRRDMQGLIHEVWVLSPEELARLESAESRGFWQELLQRLASVIR